MPLRRPLATPARAAVSAVPLASAALLPAGAARARQPQQREAERAGAPVPAGNLTDPQRGHLWASGLVGSDVHGPGGQKIGDVYDPVVEPSSGRVAAAVLAVGGSLGTGEKRVAVPLSELKHEGDRPVADTTREPLQNAPGFAARGTESARSR